MASVNVDQVASIFVDFADTLVDEFDLIEFLQMVTSRTSDVVGTSAAGLLLADSSGQLQFIAASDERSTLVELFQVQAVEGPCQDCFRLGAAVVNKDLHQASSKWPRFAPLAVSAGYQSVHAFPLRLRHEVIGALNLFSAGLGDIEADEAQLVQALADVATIGILQERAVRRGEELTGQLQHALNSRIVLEQSKGALAQMRSCTPDEAFELMRDYARRHRLRLGDVAQALVTEPRSLPDLTRLH